MGEQIELGLPTLFWKSETGELKPLEVSDANFDIELPSNWVQEDKSGFSLPFDMVLDSKQSKEIRKIFYCRIPRKKKKRFKKAVARYHGCKMKDVKVSKYWGDYIAKQYDTRI